MAEEGRNPRKQGASRGGGTATIQGAVHDEEEEGEEEEEGASEEGLTDKILEP